MQWYHILFLSIYGIFVVSMLGMKICKVTSRKRGVVKMLMSCSFVAVAVYAMVKNCGGLAILATVGLVFAALGDLLLVFESKLKAFTAGVYSFGVASTCLAVFSVLKFGWHWWSLIIFALLQVLNVLGQITKKYNYGKLKICLNCYAVLVCLCGVFGLTLLCQGVGNLSRFLFGLGCFMYYCSDLVLAMYMFRFRNKFVDAANSLLYFPGMFLVAISLLL